MARPQVPVASNARPTSKPKKKALTKPKAKSGPNWTVREALEDGQAAVRRGSGLPLRPSAEEALFRHYRPLFTKQWKDAKDWHAARAHILMLSQLVGGLACLLTLAKDFVNKRSTPVAVDAKSAVQAAEVIAFVSRLCIQGGWCPNSTPISAILAELLQELAPLGHRIPAASLSKSDAKVLDQFLGGRLG